MKYAPATVVFILIATLVLVGANVPTASAQGNLPAPTKVTAVNGPNAGEAIIIWNTVADAAYYRIGWVSYADYLTVTEEGRPWLEAFVFVDVANRGQTSYTVPRLEPRRQACLPRCQQRHPVRRTPVVGVVPPDVEQRHIILSGSSNCSNNPWNHYPSVQ